MEADQLGEQHAVFAAAQGHLRLLLTSLAREAMRNQSPSRTLSGDSLIDESLAYIHAHYAEPLRV
ncbi:hypothetical protein [Paenibacillus sacheonensis]|uniref:Uncharacterized protein n=1 Tax=Paenibacillus sacheonensis TaxID=742054 RepID=A0A7X4YN13_9BACL|nr:hypothetical protein [Paenibacillus sacheonensis]MBM7564810.1 YesN/AraC family two-component response regulator [Paenibacillus sacheonensis]NBC69358.1 hypothetical protein [Paenibacillus sacheonensis]